MPQIDELFGVATVATAAMFLAIVVQPVTSGPSGVAKAPVTTSAAHVATTPIVCLPSVAVVARRSAEVAGGERVEQVTRQHEPSDTARTRT